MRGPALDSPGRDCPCKDCQERYTACSDNCPKDARGERGYKAWKAELERINANRRAYNKLPFSKIV